MRFSIGFLRFLADEERKAPESHSRAYGEPSIPELFVAAVVAGLLYELGGGLKRLAVAEQASAVEVDVGHVELHRAARGDLPGLVEIGLRAFGIAIHETQPGEGEKAAGHVR